MDSGVALQNPDDLKSFSDEIRNIVNYINGHKSNANGKVQFPPVKFGQDATATPIPGELMAMFTNVMGVIDGQVQTLIDKLNLVADTVDAIRQNYQNATDLDQLGWQEIEQHLGISPGS